MPPQKKTKTSSGNTGQKQNVDVFAGVGDTTAKEVRQSGVVGEGDIVVDNPSLSERLAEGNVDLDSFNGGKKVEGVSKQDIEQAAEQQAKTSQQRKEQAQKDIEQIKRQKQEKNIQAAVQAQAIPTASQRLRNQAFKQQKRNIVRPATDPIGPTGTKKQLQERDTKTIEKSLFELKKELDERTINIPKGQKEIDTPETANEKVDRLFTEEDQLRKNLDEETFQAGREFSSGTDIPDKSFLTQDLPTKDIDILPTVDIKAGKAGKITEEQLKGFIGENPAEVAGLGVTTAEVAAEDIINAPAGIATIAENPVKGSKKALKEFGETIQGGSSREAKARQGLFVLSSVAGSLSAVASGSSNVARASGITDEATAATAAKRASGLEEAQQVKNKVSQKLQRFDESDPGVLIGEDTEAVKNPNELENSEPISPTGDFDTGFMGEKFRPETASIRQIVKGETPRKTREKVTVLNPENIDQIDPVSLTTKGGEEDVTPKQSRLEAVKTRVERRNEPSRQQAQFDVQDLDDTGSSEGIKDKLTNTRKGQAGKLKVVQRPDQVDVGDETSTSKLIDQDDRRQDVADEQFQVDETDSFTEDFRKVTSRDTGSAIDSNIETILGTEESSKKAPETLEDLQDQPVSSQDQENPGIEDTFQEESQIQPQAQGQTSSTDDLQEFKILEREKKKKAQKTDNTKRRSIREDFNLVRNRDLDFDESNKEFDEFESFFSDKEKRNKKGSGFAPTVRNLALGLTDTVSEKEAENLEKETFTGLGQQREVLQIEEPDKENNLEEQLGI